MIKISDGMLMSFQGSCRHGTTIHCDLATCQLCPEGNIYGIPFGLLLLTLTSMQCKKIDQYMRERRTTPRVICHPRADLFPETLNVTSKTKKKKPNYLSEAKVVAPDASKATLIKSCN